MPSKALGRLDASASDACPDDPLAQAGATERVAAASVHFLWQCLRTRPYTPRTNGKAERFIQTSLREWAYARRYESSAQRAQHLPAWLHQYNWQRPHASLGYQPPISRLLLPLNNVLGLHN